MVRRDNFVRKTAFVFLGVVILAVIGAIVLFLPEKDDSLLKNGYGGVQTSGDKINNTSFKIVAVGDISCSSTSRMADTTCEDDKVAKLITKLKPDRVALLGDLQYPSGALKDFQSNFALRWSSFLSIMYPTPGNHEYKTENADGYFTFFEQAKVEVGEKGKGYYWMKSPFANWDIYSLNSNCEYIGGCGADSEQGKWLKEKLSQSKSTCSIAMWHHPRFTSGKYNEDTDSSSRSDYFWQVLTEKGADIVLNGHDHIYERFTMQDYLGNSTSDGLVQFTVGTGGVSFYDVKKNLPNQAKIISKTPGVLELTLFEDSYSWRFIDEYETVLDSGKAKCRV